MDRKDVATPLYSSYQCHADLGGNYTSLKLPTAFRRQALSSMTAPVHALRDDLSSVHASGPLQPIHNCSTAAALASLKAACRSLQQCQSGLDWVVTAQRPNRRRGRQQRLQRRRQNSDLWVATGVCCLNLKHLQRIYGSIVNAWRSWWVAAQQDVCAEPAYVYRNSLSLLDSGTAGRHKLR